MSTDYNYTISSDFGNDITNLDMTTLNNTIKNNGNITPILKGINQEGDNVVITFASTLSNEEQITLNSIISSHVPIPEDTSFIYDAIVDKKGNGDYETITEAISSGARTIFIRSGIYTETSNINLPDNFYIMGEDKNNTIVIFGMTASGFVVDGGRSIESTGSISITNSSTIVTGSGTTFTNLSTNDYISLGSTFHEIQSIESDTSLTIKNSYRGPTLSGKTYKATTLKTGTMSNLSIAYSSGDLITLNKTINISINNVGLGMAVNGYKIMDSTQIVIGTGVVYNCGNGVNILESDKINITQMIIKNNSLDGIICTSCSNIILDGINVSASGGDGIKIVDGGENIQILDIASVYNNGNGINSESNGSSDIQSCTISNNSGKGIVTNGIGYHLIGGCVVSDSSRIGIDLSNECVLNGCMLFRNNIGIDLQGVTNCSITGSNISDNTGNGITFNASTTECIISSCQVRNNSGIGIDILGTDNIVSSCVVRGNTTAQIADGGTSTTTSNNKV